MKLTQFIEEDFVNYKKSSMFLGTSKCDGKCWREQGYPKETCQNYLLYDQTPLYVPDEIIINRYISNPITSAVVIGGLEPLLDKEEIICFVSKLREKTDDDIVIYTGYKEDEICDFISSIKRYSNIIMKFGRYVPNMKSRYDDILGVTLVSCNQYAKVIS